MNILERQMLIPSGRVLNNVIYKTLYTENNNLYIIVISVVSMWCGVKTHRTSSI